MASDVTRLRTDRRGPRARAGSGRMRTAEDEARVAREGGRVAARWAGPGPRGSRHLSAGASGTFQGRGKELAGGCSPLCVRLDSKNGQKEPREQRGGGVSSGEPLGLEEGRPVELRGSSWILRVLWDAEILRVCLR